MNLVPYDQLRNKGITLSKCQIWRLERQGKFPKRVPVSPARHAWVESEIDAYIALRVGERRIPLAGDAFDTSPATVTDTDADARKHHINHALMNRRSLNNLRLAPSTPGVYFLWKNDTLIYIGMSENILSRLKSHVAEKISFFDMFSVLPTKTRQDAAQLESLFIKVNRPQFNKADASTQPKWMKDALAGDFANVS